MDAGAVCDYFLALQKEIVARLEAADGNAFKTDEWQRAEGGGGLTRVIEEGGVFERGGVNLSRVQGKALPPSATASRPQIAGKAWQAMGVSLVLHPRNPCCPTVHMNVRFFSAGDTWWFGGGMDLTPYYGFAEDARHFHGACRDALAPFGAGLHPRYKRWCDEYFHLKHRNEPRGIGGIFFDDLAEPDFATAFSLVRSVGDHFITAYAPIIERRRATPYTQAERDFQSYRRGRTESILMSMPPAVTWRYNWSPAKGSAEEKLYTEFLRARDWV